jgi:hypothetical protein
MPLKIAVAGAGIYGATVAIRLADQGHSVDLFDPLGVLRAASAINQHRVHAGYHYPRSPETIAEILEGRSEFREEFQRAIVKRSANYYAIPHEGSRTSSDEYEEIMAKHGLPLVPCRPNWIDFDFIRKCYEVEEEIYDSDVLREMLTERIRARNVRFRQAEFRSETRCDYDFVVFAVYGLGPSRLLFKSAKYQVAEKVLIRLPAALRRIAFVVIDGPFTGFDLYGSSSFSLFGSAEHTNHWSTNDSDAAVPPQYAELLNHPSYRPVDSTNFDAMRQACALSVPAAKEARYLGSRFTMRVVEDDPEGDRRTLRLLEAAPGEFHLFSGKVVSAVKAARLISERIAGHAQAS